MLDALTSRQALRRRRHIRHWSDASFFLYGAVVWQVMMTLDEYRYHAPVILPASLILLLGAFFFLRAGTQQRGLLMLVGAVVLAFSIVAVGKYYIVPLQDGWEGWFDAHPVAIERWFEALSSVMTMLLMAPALLLPALWKPWIERPDAGPSESLEPAGEK